MPAAAAATCLLLPPAPSQAHDPATDRSCHLLLRRRECQVKDWKVGGHKARCAALAGKGAAAAAVPQAAADSGDAAAAAAGEGATAAAAQP